MVEMLYFGPDRAGIKPVNQAIKLTKLKLGKVSFSEVQFFLCGYVDLNTLVALLAQMLAGFW